MLSSWKAAFKHCRRTGRFNLMGGFTRANFFYFVLIIFKEVLKKDYKFY